MTAMIGQIQGELLTGTAQPLSGAVISDGPVALPGAVCVNHLMMLGARWQPAGDGHEQVEREPDTAEIVSLWWPPDAGDAMADGSRVEGTIRWLEPPARGPASELVVQAISGLMALHGRDQGRPRRLGLDVVSVAAGILATQGILAALIARRRGRNVGRIETSLPAAALTYLAHHLSLATCDDRFSFAVSGLAPGPPFRTADGHSVELEMLSFDTWTSFWERLGVERAEADAAWMAFVYRYLTAKCSLPPALHFATNQRTLAQLCQAAEACGVALCRVRPYAEVVSELDGLAGNGYRPRPPWAIGLAAGQTDPVYSAVPAVDAPLAGIRVVETTSRLQGPLATHLLRQLGAEVIKVEPPGGDLGRHAPPLAGSLGAAYLAYNRGKQVIELDYKRADGRAQLIDLVAAADVFVQNWPAGRAKKLDLAAEDLARVNPGLIYAHASGWGGRRPEPSAIAGDYLVQAHAGSGDGLNPVEEPGVPSRLTLVDVAGGLIACEGILAALLARERTGRGGTVETSLLAAAMTLQQDVLAALAAGEELGRHRGRPLWGPLERPLATTDGFLALVVDGESARRRLTTVCGLDSATDDQIVERLRDRPAAAWWPLLQAAGIQATVVRTDLTELPSDPRLAGLLERVNDACWAPAAPWRFTS